MALTPYGSRTMMTPVAQVEFHPYFSAQYQRLCKSQDDQQVAGEVTQLLDVLESHGHEIEGEAPEDISHPVVISTLAMFALRRTPPTAYTPYATGAPVLRIP